MLLIKPIGEINGLFYRFTRAKQMIAMQPDWYLLIKSMLFTVFVTKQT